MQILFTNKNNGWILLTFFWGCQKHYIGMNLCNFCWILIKNWCLYYTNIKFLYNNTFILCHFDSDFFILLFLLMFEELNMLKDFWKIKSFSQGTCYHDNGNKFSKLWLRGYKPQWFTIITSPENISFGCSNIEKVKVNRGHIQRATENPGVLDLVSLGFCVSDCTLW